MFRRPLIVLLMVLAFVATVHASEPLRVGVLVAHGGSAVSRTNAFEALRIDPAIEPRLVSPSDILTGTLDDLDVLVLPGGSGSRQMSDLGELAAARVRAFVTQHGKGVVGLCAGAYMLSDTPDYLCLRLTPLAAIDREHDERGHGIVAFSVTDTGLDLFPELSGSDLHHIYYYEGPLLVPSSDSGGGEVAATFVTDVHLENDAPAELMPGKPLLARAEAGRGRVFLCSGHPEATPGLRWMVPRMVRWVARREVVAYSSVVVRPAAHSDVILFDDPLREEEHGLLGQLRSESPFEERANAIRRLAEMRSWGAANWAVGSLRSNDPRVQRAAALALSELEATWALPDLQAVQTLDLEPSVRATLEHVIVHLSAMVARGEKATGAAERRVAVTFDDLPAVSTPGARLSAWSEMTQRLLGSVTRHQVPAVGFVNGGKLVGDDGMVEVWRSALLDAWLDAGLELGNHTFAHRDLHRVPVEQYLDDIVAGDESLRAILAEHDQEPRYFRHPYLHTGRDAATKGAVRGVLEKRGYRVAPVTVDHSEWVFAAAYARAVSDGDTQTAARVRDAYLPYMESQLAYFEQQSAALFGREIPQVLLLHANLLNADTFDQLAARIERRGYRFVSLDEVLEDPVYALGDGYDGVAGISWLHRWCFALGGRHLVLPGQPRCPQWVMDLAGVDSE